MATHVTQKREKLNAKDMQNKSIRMSVHAIGLQVDILNDYTRFLRLANQHNGKTIIKLIKKRVQNKRKQRKNYIKTRWYEKMHRNWWSLSFPFSPPPLSSSLCLLSADWWEKYPLYLIEYIQNFSCHLITSTTKSIYHNDKFSVSLPRAICFPFFLPNCYLLLVWRFSCNFHVDGMRFWLMVMDFPANRSVFSRSVHFMLIWSRHPASFAFNYVDRQRTKQCLKLAQYKDWLQFCWFILFSNVPSK